MDNPYPYDAKPYTVKPEVTEVSAGNVCTNLAALKTASGTTVTDHSAFNTYLKNLLDYDYTLKTNQLIDLQNKCASTCTVKLLEEPLALPVALVTPASSTSRKLACTDVSTAITTFEGIYTTVSTTSKLYQVLLTNYLNPLSS